MHTGIRIQEPFRNSWNEPQIIVTQEDIVEYENAKIQTGVPQMESNNTCESQIKCRSNTIDMDNDHTRTEMFQNKLMDIQKSLLQSRMVEQQLQTPKKQCDNAYAEDSELSSRSVMSTANYLVSPSLPSSPTCGTLPNTTFSPKVPSSPQGYLGFIPESFRFLEQLSENDEVDNGLRQSQRCFSISQGKNRHPCPCHEALKTPRRTTGSLYFESEIQTNETAPLRAKRRLDMDDPYSTSAKRAKSDLSQEAGIRYISQLEMDLMSLKHRMLSPSTEKMKRTSNCACSVMLSTNCACSHTRTK